MTRTLKAVMKKMVRKNPKSMCLQKWLLFLTVSFFIFTDFFLFRCFPFLYRRKIIFEGLVWAQKEIFPHYSIFSTILTLKVAMDTFGSVILFLEQMAQ